MSMGAASTHINTKKAQSVVSVTKPECLISIIDQLRKIILESTIKCEIIKSREKGKHGIIL